MAWQQPGATASRHQAIIWISVCWLVIRERISLEILKISALGLSSKNYQLRLQLQGPNTELTEIMLYFVSAGQNTFTWVCIWLTLQTTYSYSWLLRNIYIYIYHLYMHIYSGIIPVVIEGVGSLIGLYICKKKRPFYNFKQDITLCRIIFFLSSFICKPVYLFWKGQVI